MGDAKRRGTREQRIEQAIARRKIEDAARSAAYKAQRQAEAERIRNLPPEERKEVILAGGSAGRHRALLAAAMATGFAAPLLAIRSHDGDQGRSS